MSNFICKIHSLVGLNEENSMSKRLDMPKIMLYSAEVLQPQI